MRFPSLSFIVLIFCCGPGFASAQSTRDYLLDVKPTIGYGFARGIEERFSQDIQLGNPVSFGISGFLDSKKSILTASIEFNLGNFEFSRNKSISINRKSVDVNVGYALSLVRNERDRLGLFGGINLGFFRANRTYTELLNNSNSFESVIPIDLLLLLKHNFFSNRIQVENKTFYTVAGMSQQPAYGNSGASESSPAKWEFASLKSLFRFINQTGFSMKLADRHCIGLNYAFKYYELASQRKVKYREHLTGVFYKLSL